MTTHWNPSQVPSRPPQPNPVLDRVIGIGVFALVILAVIGLVVLGVSSGTGEIDPTDIWYFTW